MIHSSRFGTNKVAWCCDSLKSIGFYKIGIFKVGFSVKVVRLIRST